MQKNAILKRAGRYIVIMTLAIMFTIAHPALAQGPVPTSTPLPVVTDAQKKAAEDKARADAAAATLAAAQAAFQNAQLQAAASQDAYNQAIQFAAQLDSQHAQEQAARAADLAKQAVDSAGVVLASVQSLNGTIQSQQAEIKRLNGQVNDLTAVITIQRGQIEKLQSDGDRLTAQAKQAQTEAQRPLLDTSSVFMVLIVVLMILAGWAFVRSRREASPVIYEVPRDNHD